jgi:hypothetical protein
VNVKIGTRKSLVQAALVVCLGIVVAAPRLKAQVQGQTLDALVFDYGAANLKSLKNGMAVGVSSDIGDLIYLQECGDNPINLVLGLNPATFYFTYANGYSFSASGHIMVTTHENLPIDNPNPFLGLSFLVHLKVDGTSQHRGSDWPRVGDDVIGGSELVIGADPLLGEGAFRIVRPATN